MFAEDLCQITADHLREHIREYLDRVNARFDADEQLELVVPKSIEVSSVVGGQMTKFDQILPQYSIDIVGKSRSEDAVALWTYEYPGQINGLVHAGSEDAADKLVKRHAAAVEAFIHDHQYLHSPVVDGFSLVEFVFAVVDYSGAEDLGTDTSNRSVWIAGFSINCSWFTSEQGPSQHGTA